jgi:hypothetical protein
METEVVFEGWGDRIEHADISPCTEELVPCAANYQHMYVFVEAYL